MARRLDSGWVHSPLFLSVSWYLRSDSPLAVPPGMRSIRRGIWALELPMPFCLFPIKGATPGRTHGYPFSAPVWELYLQPCSICGSADILQEAQQMGGFDSTYKLSSDLPGWGSSNLSAV